MGSSGFAQLDEMIASCRAAGRLATDAAPEVARNVEASLRRELEEQLAHTARWAQRIKALEARLERITNIAGGHAVVDEGSEN